MSLLADYYVLTDGDISPPLATAGALHDFPVPLPTNFHQSSAHLPILSFRLDTGIPTDLTFRISTSKFSPPPPLAGLQTTLTAVYNSDVFHSVHEIVSIDHLLGGAVNTIRVERLSGTGTLIISDVVLWYKRNVTTTNLAIAP